MKKIYSILLVVFLAGMAALGATQSTILSHWIAAIQPGSVVAEPTQTVAVTPAKGNDKGGQSKAVTQMSAAKLKQTLEEKLPGIEIESIEQSPLPGFYQVFYSGELIYVSTDGQYIFNGDLLEISDGIVNHSDIAMRAKDQEKAPERKAAIDAIDESDMVVFAAKDEKYKITVFTDVDCAYCRKLHKEIPQLNAAGVTVRYLAYPRAGIGSSSYNKLVSVWCADDKQAAMNAAKLHRQFKTKTCKNPVSKQYYLTRKFNLSGTPSIILGDGELIVGYVPHGQLLAHLMEKSGQTAVGGR